MLNLKRRKLLVSEAEFLVDKIKLSYDITGYSLNEWLNFDNVLISENETGQMVGICLSYNFSDEWSFISVLFVRENYRRKGIGKQLFYKTCQDILAGSRNIYTASRNPIVIRMMSEFGFIFFDTLYKLPENYKEYEFDFLMRTFKWIASCYRIKEYFRKFIQYQNQPKFIYGICNLENFVEKAIK